MTPLKFISVERASHADARIRDAQYWATKTIAERVIAGWKLAEDDYSLRGASEQEKQPNPRPTITFRRVPRRRR